MDNKLKQLVKNNPNDTELGAKVRAYLENNKVCCDDKKNHITTAVSFTALMEDNEEIHCKVCGKFISMND